MVAGLVHLSMRRFIPLNLIGALVWTTTLISVGAVVGERWQSAEHIISWIGIILGVVVVAILSKWLLTHWIDQKVRKEI
jgi:membrane protein DedA with SNARE-associated domain